MWGHRVLLLFAALIAICLGITCERALAATPSFTISASNSTMTASGSSSVAWTVTSVNGYTGNIHLIAIL